MRRRSHAKRRYGRPSGSSTIGSAIFALLYFTLPDFPTKNTGLTYFKILWTMAKFAVTEPILIQAVLVSFASMACFTNFWVRPHAHLPSRA